MLIDYWENTNQSIQNFADFFLMIVAAKNAPPPSFLQKFAMRLKTYKTIWTGGISIARNCPPQWFVGKRELFSVRRGRRRWRHMTCVGGGSFPASAKKKKKKKIPDGLNLYLLRYLRTAVYKCALWKMYLSRNGTVDDLLECSITHRLLHKFALSVQFYTIGMWVNISLYCFWFLFDLFIPV